MHAASCVIVFGAAVSDDIVVAAATFFRDTLGEVYYPGSGLNESIQISGCCTETREGGKRGRIRKSDPAAAHANFLFHSPHNLFLIKGALPNMPSSNENCILFSQTLASHMAWKQGFLDFAVLVTNQPADSGRETAQS